MDFLRKFLSVLNLLALWLFIGAIGLFFILSQILKPTVIKNWIAADSGYHKITQAIKENLEVSKNGAPNEMVNQAMSAITPELIQKEVEIVIDRYFNYLKGDKTAMTLSSAEINSQIFKSININPADLPLEAQQMVPDFQLPVMSDSSYAQATRYYRWVFVDQPWILGIIGALMLLMILFRFHFRDRMSWLFWSVFVPFIGLLLSFLAIVIAKAYALKTDTLFSKLAPPVKEIAYSKVKSFFGLVYNAELQLVLIELTVVVVLMILYIVAKHLNKPAAVPSPTPPTPVAPPSPPATPIK